MGATCHACIGGTNVRNEMQKLQAEAPHIVVGTPGRVFDMLNRRYLCKYSFKGYFYYNPKILVRIFQVQCGSSYYQLQNGSKCLFWMKQMKC